MSGELAIRDNIQRIQVGNITAFKISTLQVTNYITINEKTVATDGFFDLYFSSPDFVITSAPLNATVWGSIGVEAKGDTSTGHILKLIDVDTGNILIQQEYGSKSNGWLHTSMFSSEREASRFYEIPFMPNRNWHLRAQFEDPEGNVYIQKDVVIIKGEYSNNRPKCKMTIPSLPSELNPGEKFNIPSIMSNIGDTVGLIDATLYLTPNFPKIVSWLTCMPTHPKFCTETLTLGDYRMPRYHEHIVWKGYSYSPFEGIGYHDDTKEAIVTCKNPAACDCIDEKACYECEGQGADWSGACYWDISNCGIPNKICKPFVSYLVEQWGDISWVYPFDDRFDINEDGECDFNDIGLVSKFAAEFDPPSSYKIIYNCNPDIDAYSKEIKDWFLGTPTPTPTPVPETRCKFVGTISVPGSLPPQSAGGKPLLCNSVTWKNTGNKAGSCYMNIYEATATGDNIGIPQTGKNVFLHPGISTTATNLYSTVSGLSKDYPAGSTLYLCFVTFGEDETPPSCSAGSIAIPIEEQKAKEKAKVFIIKP